VLTLLAFLNQLQPDAAGFLAIFAAIFLLSIIPIFAPPTWIALSAISLGTPALSPYALALVGALAATSGRVVLAKMSRMILRGKLLGDHSRQNIDEMRHAIERRQLVSASGILLYAFSPLPSNHLFIAYGLTNLSILLAAAPFFIGRLISYSFWTLTAAAAGKKLDYDVGASSTWLSAYFIASQLLLLPLLYLIVKIDWKLLIRDRHLRLRTSEHP
jgi:membrane protein DedA with SNARE-associated domain